MYNSNIGPKIFFSRFFKKKKKKKMDRVERELDMNEEKK
jgi:hypothetical protein